MIIIVSHGSSEKMNWEKEEGLWGVQKEKKKIEKQKDCL